MTIWYLAKQINKSYKNCKIDYKKVLTELGADLSIPKCKPI
jgi:KUP system potassium uptake protein